MKFRISKYYERFLAEVYNEKQDEWFNIGLPNGHADVEGAEDACRAYKARIDDKIVKVFEL